MDHIWSNSNSNTISNQPWINELEMQSILFELDPTISYSIKKMSSANSIWSYRAQFLLSSVCLILSSTVCTWFRDHICSEVGLKWYLNCYSSTANINWAWLPRYQMWSDYFNLLKILLSYTIFYLLDHFLQFTYCHWLNHVD